MSYKIIRIDGKEDSITSNNFINFSDAYHVSGVSDSTEYMYDVITNWLLLWEFLLDG